MGDHDLDNGESHMSRALELISAVANRDAAPEDIVAQMRNDGVDSLDVLVAVLARAARQPADRLDAQRPVDVRRFSKPTPPERAAKIVHRVPSMPFVLDGTLYDPEDVRRFDGRELHFVAGHGDELLAFDDRSVIARTWELTYAASLSTAGVRSFSGASLSSSAVEGYQYGGYHYGGYGSSGVRPQDIPIAGPGPEESGPLILWPKKDKRGAYFYDDKGTDGWGEELFLRPNRGYWDLTEVGRGILGLGDWNDVISAFSMKDTYVVVLYEHINMEGDTLTGLPSSGLGPDWNDRASSVACW